MKFPEAYRQPNPHPDYQSQPGDRFGIFYVPPRAGIRRLKILATDGADTGWEHVSVSVLDHQRETPTWEEMCVVKDLFWDESEWVVQYHPARSEYVNIHRGVLHLWRCVNTPLPIPHKLYV